MFIADLGLAGKVRPVVILSREDGEPPSALAIAVPLSLENRGSRYEVPMPRVPWLKHRGVASVQGIFSVGLHVPFSRAQRGTLTALKGQTIPAQGKAVRPPPWVNRPQQSSPPPMRSAHGRGERGVGRAPAPRA